jgi:hypothetical protein
LQLNMAKKKPDSFSTGGLESKATAELTGQQAG